jgi:hypothetical protein
MVRFQRTKGQAGGSAVLERPPKTRPRRADEDGEGETAREDDLPPDVREFARALQEYKEASGRMFPTWSEVLEVLLDLGYRKEGRAPVAANQALLVWTHERGTGSCSSRLLALDDDGALLATAGLPPSGASARFCLTQPDRTGWVEARVAAVGPGQPGPHQVRVSGFRGPALGDIRRAVAPDDST